MSADGLVEASPFRLLRDTFGSGTSHNVIFIGDKRTIAKVLNLYLEKSAYFLPCLHRYSGINDEIWCNDSWYLLEAEIGDFVAGPSQMSENSSEEVADEIVEKKSGLMKLLSSSSKDSNHLTPFKPESLTELPQSRKFVYYTLTNSSKIKFTKFVINFSVLDSKTPLETRRKVYGQACWELVYLFVHLNHRQSVASVIRDWYPELRAFVAKPRVLIGLEAPTSGLVIGKQRKASPMFVSPYQAVVSSESIFAIDYVHIKPSKPTTIKDLFSEKCINLWKDPTPVRSWMQGRIFETRKPLFYDRVINQKSEHGMYYVDFSDLKPAPDDMELFLQGETSNKTSFFFLPFDKFVAKIPANLLTVGTRQVSFFGCNLTTFDASKLSTNYLWYINVLVLMNNEINALVLHGSLEKPKSMCFLNLRELYACSNKLTRVPSSIPHITTLTILDLRKNCFSTFPTIVCNCKALEKLDLGDNQISSIPPEIGKLITLRELHLNNNSLSTLPVEIGRLFNLKTLMLQHNTIHKLPLIMANLTTLTTLELSGNPLVDPPTEVLAGGLDSMRSYMSDQLRSGERSFRMKLMFVGQENVGKTSLVRAIKRQIANASQVQAGQPPLQVNPSERPPLSTDGIDIETITMQHVDSIDQSKHVLQFTVLDFAGQEIYYATHQVFLTERAVYMVVWDLRKTPKECRVDYWLHAITAAAPKSPIFLVGTHLDDKSVDTKKALANIESLIPQYRKRFRIRGLEMVSCIAGDNVSGMVTNICNAALREPTMGAKLPTSYFIFEEHLQMRRNQLKEANKAPIMTYEEIRNLAIDCGVIGSKTSIALPLPEVRARAGTYVPKSSRVRRTGPISTRHIPSTPLASPHTPNGSRKVKVVDEDDIIPDVPSNHPKLLEMKSDSSSSSSASSSKSTSNTSSHAPSSHGSDISRSSTSSTTPSSGAHSPTNASSTPITTPTNSSESASASSPNTGPSNGNASSATDEDSSKASDANESEDNAVLHNTLVLFHELGSIVYLGEHLDSFIMLDPQWITKVFASILTTKHNFAKEGMLGHNDVITHLWGKNTDFPPQLHSIMLDLLEHFQCVFKMPDFAFSNLLLVPQFLSDKRPDMRLIWPPHYIPGVTQYTRLYDLGYTPVGLIGRILVTLMQETIVQTFWRNGMILYSKQERQHMALVELVESSYQEPVSSQSGQTATQGGPIASQTSQNPISQQGAFGNPSPAAHGTSLLDGSSSGLHYRLSVTVRGIGCEDLFRTIVAVVDYICSAWYHLDATDQMLVKSNYCPTCVSQGLEQPMEFTMRRCEACLVSGSIICTKNPEDWHIVRVDQVAPDIAWADFQSKIVDVATEVNVVSELGKGTNGPVYKATYNSEYVAMKASASIGILESQNVVSATTGGSSTLSLPVMSVSALSSAMEEVRREVQFLSSLKHPNLVQLVAFGMTKPPTLMLEFVPLGPLPSFLSSSHFSFASSRNTVNATGWTPSPPRDPNMPDASLADRRDRWPLIVHIAFDVASALLELHSARPAIIHGNLSQRKVYISSSNWNTPVVAKVAFVGTSSSFHTQAQSKPNTSAIATSDLHTTTRTTVPIPRDLAWCAPEVLRGERPTAESDVYSFGIILWQLVTRLTPFARDTDHAALVARILSGERPDVHSFPLGDKGSYSELYFDLMVKCWDADPAKRPSFASILGELIPQIMADGMKEVWEVCKIAQMELQEMRKEQEALVLGTDIQPSNAIQDLVLGRWIANIDTSNARVRKMLPVQSLGEVWCLTDLGHILVYSMASGQFLRKYEHVLPSISSFAFCNLFHSEDTVWVASNKMIVKISALPASATPTSTATNAASIVSSGTGSPPGSVNARTAHFDFGAPVEGVLSIKDERYTKRAGWCRLANGVMHFYKRQGELVPWNVANLTDIDIIEPHFQGHTTFLMKMKDKTIFMGGGRNATLSWQEIITKQKSDFEASRTKNALAKPVFYCSVDQRMWSVQVVDNVAWILLNDRRLVRWDLKQSAPSGYIDLAAHMKQKDFLTASSSLNPSTMVVVTLNMPATATQTPSASPQNPTTPNIPSAPSDPTATASPPTSKPSASTSTSPTRKILWVSLQNDIIRISLPDGIVFDVLHAPQGDISLMTFHPARNEVWTYSSGLLRIRNAFSGKSQLIIPLDRAIHAMTPIGPKMWLHFNRNIQIWNEYRLSSELEHRHETPVHDILYLEHNRTAWTSSVDAINVWK